MMRAGNKNLFNQQGVAAVEFAIIAMLLFTVLFGIIEFGRMFYVFNTVQEVTRRAARAAVVNWADAASQNAVKQQALFGGASLPAGAEITADNIRIEYLTENGGDPGINPETTTPADNLAACLSGPAGCIVLVRVSITGATYAPMVGLFPFMNVPIPASTVTMPAESLGYTGN